MGHHLVTGIANLTNNGVGGRNHNYSSNRLSQQRAMARARRPPMYPNPNSRLVPTYLDSFKRSAKIEKKIFTLPENICTST